MSRPATVVPACLPRRRTPRDRPHAAGAPGSLARALRARPPGPRFVAITPPVASASPVACCRTIWLACTAPALCCTSARALGSPTSVRVLLPPAYSARSARPVVSSATCPVGPSLAAVQDAKATCPVCTAEDTSSAPSEAGASPAPAVQRSTRSRSPVLPWRAPSVPVCASRVCPEPARSCATALPPGPARKVVTSSSPLTLLDTVRASPPGNGCFTDPNEALPARRTRRKTARRPVAPDSGTKSANNLVRRQLPLYGPVRSRRTPGEADRPGCSHAAQQALGDPSSGPSFPPTPALACSGPCRQDAPPRRVERAAAGSPRQTRQWLAALSPVSVPARISTAPFASAACSEPSL